MHVAWWPITDVRDETRRDRRGGNGHLVIAITPILLAAAYIAGGSLWILYSDAIVSLWVSDRNAMIAWEGVKGIGFISITGGLFYHLLHKHAKERAHLEEWGWAQAEIVNGLSEIVVACNAEGEIKIWNGGAEAATGRNAGEVADKPFLSLVDAESKAIARNAFQSVMGGQPTATELSLIRRDGSKVRCHFRGFPIRDSRGHVMGAVTSGRDLTEKLHTERKLRESLRGFETLVEQTVSAFAVLVEKRDRYLAGHQSRVTELALAIAGELGLNDDQKQGLRLASLCHDIGKIGIPAEIMSKPGALTDSEFEMIKSHSQNGFEILAGISFPWPVAEIVLQHHERIDGSGYPHGLLGDDIRIEARILGVADTIEAMTSHRPYRPGLGMDVALAEIVGQRDRRYDAHVVDACVALVRDGRFKFN